MDHFFFTSLLLPKPAQRMSTFLVSGITKALLIKSAKSSPFYKLIAFSSNHLSYFYSIESGEMYGV